jgi:hypothetical protein
MLSPKRDLIAAKLFLRLALSAGGPSPRVINVDGHPAYPSAVAELKQSGELGRRCRCRTARYLNNVIEQDHGFIKKRVATLWLQRLHDWALWYCTVAPQPHRGCRSRASRDEGPHCPLGSFNGRVVSLESQPVAVSSVECRQAASSSGDRHPWPALYGGAGKHRLLLQCRMNCFRTFPNYIPDQS